MEERVVVGGIIVRRKWSIVRRVPPWKVGRQLRVLAKRGSNRSAREEPQFHHQGALADELQSSRERV